METKNKMVIALVVTALLTINTFSVDVFSYMSEYSNNIIEIADGENSEDIPWVY